MLRVEKAWRHIVVGLDDHERVRDQAFDQHAKGTLFYDDRCEPEPDGDAVDEFDPLGDELSDGRDDDTGEGHPPEDTDPPPEGAQHDVTLKSEPPPEDTDAPPEPAAPMTTMPSRLATLRIVYGRPTDRDLQAAACIVTVPKKVNSKLGPRELISKSNSQLGLPGTNLDYFPVTMVHPQAPPPSAAFAGQWRQRSPLAMTSMRLVAGPK